LTSAREAPRERLRAIKKAAAPANGASGSASVDALRLMDLTNLKALTPFMVRT
jgi:maleate cis-trans isomerase